MEKILRTKVRVEPTPSKFTAFSPLYNIANIAYIAYFHFSDGQPDPETGKMPTTKYNYYHINYRSIVKIVKEPVYFLSSRYILYLAI